MPRTDPSMSTTPRPPSPPPRLCVTPPTPSRPRSFAVNPARPVIRSANPVILSEAKDSTPSTSAAPSPNHPRRAPFPLLTSHFPPPIKCPHARARDPPRPPAAVAPPRRPPPDRRHRRRQHRPRRPPARSTAHSTSPSPASSMSTPTPRAQRARHFGIDRVFASLDEALGHARRRLRRRRPARRDRRHPRAHARGRARADPEAASAATSMTPAASATSAASDTSTAAVNFQLRFAPNMLALRDALERGLLGDDHRHRGAHQPAHAVGRTGPSSRACRGSRC